VAAVASQVCSTPNNRHSPLERTRPFGANKGHGSRDLAQNIPPMKSLD
jgi:hypothetical protein